MEQWLFLGTLMAPQSKFFWKTLDSDTLKIYISAQVSSFAREKQLKTRNFKPVCGKERKMSEGVTVVSVKKPRIPLIRPAQVADVTSFAGQKRLNYAWLEFVNYVYYKYRDEGAVWSGEGSRGQAEA